MPKGNPAPCGTKAGYQRHRRNGESCDECRAAAAAYERERKWARRERADAERLADAPVIGGEQVADTKRPMPRRSRVKGDAKALDGMGSVAVEQKLRAGTEPVLLEVPTGEDPLASARWRLAKVRASMEVATPRDMAPLAKREEEIVELLERLTGAQSGKKVSVLDQLAERRAQRVTDAAG